MSDWKQVEADMGRDGDWQHVEIPELDGSRFRFRTLAEGGFDVEVYPAGEADEVPATWYTRGYLECYAEMLETIRRMMEGLPEQG